MFLRQHPSFGHGFKSNLLVHKLPGKPIYSCPGILRVVFSPSCSDEPIKGQNEFVGRVRGARIEYTEKIHRKDIAARIRCSKTVRYDGIVKLKSMARLMTGKGLV